MKYDQGRRQKISRRGQR